MNIQTKAHFTHQFFKNLIKEKKGSILELYYMEILEKRIIQKFRTENSTKHKENLNHMSIIDFDDNIQDCKNILFFQLLKVGEYYEYLCGHVLCLQDLFDRSTELIKQNQTLIKTFHDLFQVNPNNVELQFLSAIYTSILDFEDRKKWCNASKYEQNQIQKTQQKLRQYFTNDSCVVFSTFMKKVITIQKVSKQFQNIFKYDNSYIKDMSINTIIPKYFQSDHDEILDFFCNKGQMSIIDQGQRFVFGLDSDGFIIPLMIQLKIENRINDFGVSALFSRINHTKDYIFLSSDNQILDMTKNIYNIISSFTQRSMNDLRQNSVLQFIPLIWITEEAKEYNVEYSSILISQRSYLNEFNGNNYFSLTKREKIKQMFQSVKEQNDSQFFNISFKHCIFTINSIDKTYKYIEINRIDRENKKPIVDVSLQYLSRSLNDLIAQKNIQSKEQDQLRQYQRNLEGDSQKTDSESSNDWGSPISHKRSQLLINKQKRKNNLLLTLKDQMLEQQKENNSIQQDKNRNFQKDLFVNTLFDKKYNQIENNLMQSERLESYRIQNMSNQNINFVQESKNNFSFTNIFENQYEHMNNELNRSIQQIKHLDHSQRQFKSQLQESFAISPTRDQHLSYLQPRSTNTSIQIFSNNQLNSPLVDNSNNISNTTQNKKDQLNGYQLPNLKQIDEKQNNNSIKQKQKDEYLAKQLINDRKTNQRQQIQQNSISSSEDIENLVTSQYIYQRKRSFLKSNVQQKNKGNNDDINEGSLNFVDQHKQNLRKYSLEIEENLQNNYIQEDQQSIQKKNDNIQSKSKRSDNDNTFLSQLQNVVSIRVINEEDQLEQSQKLQKGELQSYKDFNNQNIKDKDNMSLQENFGIEENFDDDNSGNMKIEQQYRRSISQSSIISSNYQQMKSIVQKVKSKRVAGVVLILSIMSFLSFLMFFTITVLMHFDSIQSLYQFKTVLSFMDKPVFVIIDTLKIIKSTTYNQLIENNYSNEYQEDICIKERQIARMEAYNSLQDFRNLYINLHQNRDFNYKIMDYLGNNNLTIKAYTFGFHLGVDGNNLSDDFTETQIIINQFNAIGVYFGSMYGFIKSFDRYLYEFPESIDNIISEEIYAMLQWNNLDEFTIQMTKFSEFVQNDTFSQFETLKIFQINLVLIVCGVCCLSVFSILPLYMYKQNSREQILRLIGSFKPNLLSQQNVMIEQSLSIIELKYSSFNHHQNDSLKHFPNSFRFQQNISLKFQQNSLQKHQRRDKKNKILNQRTLNQIMDNSSQLSQKKQQKKQVNSKILMMQKDQKSEQFIQINLSSLNSKRNQQSSSTQFQHSINGEKTKSTEYQLEQQPYYIKKNNNKRNRSIASFQNLRKFNIIGFLLSLLAIGVLMIQPALTVILTSQFIKEQQALINEKKTILFSLSSILQNATPNYALLNLGSFGFKAHDTVYFNYYSKIRKQNVQQIKGLQSLLDNFSLERKDQTSFDQFYKQVINGNICGLKDTYNQFLKSNFTKDECEKMGNGILKRGLIISMKGLFHMWDDFYNQYEKYTSDDWESQNHWRFLENVIREKVKQNSLIDINNLNTLLIQSTEAVLSYQSHSQKNYEQYILNIYDYLLIAQIFIIFLIFFFSWVKLYKSFDTQLTYTKQIFTLFHISLLSQNSFIIQYFKENSFGVK